MNTELLQEYLNKEVLSRLLSAGTSKLNLISECMPGSMMLLVIFVFFLAIIILVFAYCYIDVIVNKYFAKLSQGLKDCFFWIPIILTLGIILILLSVLSSALLILNYRSDLRNLKCTEIRYTCPIEKHSMDYITSNSPIALSGTHIPDVFDNYINYDNMRPPKAKEIELVEAADNNQTATVVAYRIEGMTDKIANMLRVAENKKIIKSEVLDILKDYTYLEKISYSNSSDALQPSFKEIIIPKQPIYIDNQLKGITIQGKEGKTIKIEDAEKILSDTCKLEVEYGRSEVYEKNAVYDPNTTERKGSYVYTIQNVKAYVLPTDRNISNNVDVNVDVNVDNRGTNRNG